MVNHDLRELLDIVMPYAIESVSQRGGFQPFGFCIDHTGDINPHLARTGGMRKPYRREIDELYRDMRNLAVAKKIRALATCREIPFRAPDEDSIGAAILCSFEHENGNALDLVLPFEFASDSKSVLFGKLLRKQRQIGFFVNRRSVPMSTIAKAPAYRTASKRCAHVRQLSSRVFAVAREQRSIRRCS